MVAKKKPKRLMFWQRWALEREAKRLAKITYDPDDHTKEFGRKAPDVRKKRYLYTDQPRYGAAREKGGPANLARSESTRYRAYTLVKQLAEDKVRDDKLDADRRKMFDVDYPRLVPGSVLDLELKYHNPKVVDHDPFLNPLPKPPPLPTPELNQELVKAIHTSMKLYKDLYKPMTPAYKEVYFQVKEEVLRRVADEAFKRPATALDPEGYKPPPTPSLERIPVEGQPRGIIRRPDRWTKYKRRVIPQRRPPSKLQTQGGPGLRNYSPELFYHQDVMSITEPVRYKGRPTNHSLNVHFHRAKYIVNQRRYFRKITHFRLMEFGFGDGFGTRLRLHIRPLGNRNYLMQTMGKAMYCMPWLGYCLRRQTYNHILRNWDTYKAAVKRQYMYCSKFFRKYDPNSENEWDHVKARWLFQSNIRGGLSECGLVELAVCCALHKRNLVILEMDPEGRYFFRRGHTQYKKFIFFFAQAELDKTRRYTSYFITWLKIFPTPRRNVPIKLFVPNVEVFITHYNRRLYYWRFSEKEGSYDDPPPPIEKVRKPHRRKVHFGPLVHVLHYHEPLPQCFLFKYLRDIGCMRSKLFDDWLFDARVMTDREIFLEYVQRWKKIHKKAKYREKTHSQAKRHAAKIQAFIDNAMKTTSEQVFARRDFVVRKWERSVTKVANITKFTAELKTDVVAKAAAAEAAKYKALRKQARRNRRVDRKELAGRTISNVTW